MKHIPKAARITTAVIWIILWPGGCAKNTLGPRFQAGGLFLELNGRGHISQLKDRQSGRNYLAEGIPSPLLSIRRNGELMPPDSVEFDDGRGNIHLYYPESLSAIIHVEEKESHLTFELTSVSPEEGVELAVWGPYATTVKDIIGETIGVVRDQRFSLGIQALNPKTLGGFPWNENDCMPQLDIFESGDYSDLSEEGKRHVLYRVEAAKPESFGSTLQAYCRDRGRERVVENWGHTAYLVPPFDDGGIIGTKIALFGCAEEKTMETIGRIEMAEGLPHPLIDGQWGKTAPSASAAYMIIDFGEEDIDRAIEYTRRAGLRYLYHPGPFKTWGHFELNDKFPNGRQGLRRCVEKAGAAGLMVGLHTLSNFITTNDPYVTPVPDPRLARVGTTLLSSAITSNQTDIPIHAPGLFDETQTSHLKTVKIEEELIRYGRISSGEPWTLLDCRRGAFGTTPSSHRAQTPVGKLADHAYKVFLTNAALGREMAENIAGLFNECGLRQISFDGLEGNRSTGMGNYGEVLFTNAWYEGLSENIRRHFIADASRTSHYFWHIFTRMNWGEPWYAGFRESQTEYRLKNQAYFRRNLMPGMLGWFLMKPDTSIEDIEWLLARSAAFDAGFAFVTGYEALEKNGYSDRILEAIGIWEKARMDGAFSEAQKSLMEDIRNEFHLEPDEGGGWRLTRMFSRTFRHEPKDRQPGEPDTSSFPFTNPAEKQPLGFILTALGADLSEIRLELDGYREVLLPLTLKAGQSLKYSGGDAAVLMDRNWRTLREISVDESDFLVGPGEHTLLFDSRFSNREEAAARLEIRLTGRSEPVGRDEALHGSNH